MIKLRIDVDYAYASRVKSFVSTLGLPVSKRGYLVNCKVLADLVNRAHNVEAYWFFTSKTLPDKELLALIADRAKHIVGLHVVKDPVKELMLLQSVCGGVVRFYSIHGTDKLFSQLLWGRSIGQRQVFIPLDFSLKSIHSVPTGSLDFGISDSKFLLSLHPDWLFKRSWSGRGPVYPLLVKLFLMNLVIGGKN